jgi:hypothetical protein
MPFPFGATDVHVSPASPVQSLFWEQTWKLPAPVHIAEGTHAVPVNPDTYGNPGTVAPPGPHPGCGPSISMLPVPQQTVPGIAAQSGAPSHCQTVDPATGQAIALDVQTESAPLLSGGSQHCCPLVQNVLGCPGAPLNGQYTPGIVSG